MYTTEAAAAGESNFVWLSKTKFVFFVGIGKCAIVKARSAFNLCMILVQSVFNDHKDLFSFGGS